MSRLDELITELCSDGVEFKTLGELSLLVTKQTGFDYSNHIKSRLVMEQQLLYVSQVLCIEVEQKRKSVSI